MRDAEAVERKIAQMVAAGPEQLQVSAEGWSDELSDRRGGISVRRWLAGRRAGRALCRAVLGRKAEKGGAGGGGGRRPWLGAAQRDRWRSPFDIKGAGCNGR